MPASKKAAGDKRAFGLGLSSRLYGVNKIFGIAPREDGDGEGCGGSAVGGRDACGLNVQCMRRPSAYASATDGWCL